MKNTIGNSVAVTLFGESHGSYIGAVLDGMAPGIYIKEEYIAHMLTLRRPSGRISTTRREKDAFVIVSGVVNGRTTRCGEKPLPYSMRRPARVCKGQSKELPRKATVWAEFWKPSSLVCLPVWENRGLTP